MTAAHNFADDSGGNDSSSTTVTVNEPGAEVSVSSINPNSVQAGGSVDVTISGSNFAAGVSVTFENGSGPAPTMSNVVVVDGNTITTTISTSTKGPKRTRVWDVRVTN